MGVSIDFSTFIVFDSVSSSSGETYGDLGGGLNASTDPGDTVGKQPRGGARQGRSGRVGATPPQASQIYPFRRQGGQTQVLLCRREQQPQRGEWSANGGKSLGNESGLSTALRGFQEETTIQLNPGALWMLPEKGGNNDRLQQSDFATWMSRADQQRLPQ